jgi:hypothetical protein
VISDCSAANVCLVTTGADEALPSIGLDDFTGWEVEDFV